MASWVKWSIAATASGCVVLSCLWEGSMANRSVVSGNNSTAPDEVEAAPPIRLEAFPEYLLGFPMLIAVTCENSSKKATYYNLPDCSMFRAPGPVELVFTAPDGESKVLPVTSLGSAEGPADGFTLRPGESRRMLFDIAELNPTLEPGDYRLEGHYRLQHGSSASPPIRVRLTQPDPSDAEEANHLRIQNDLQEPSWANFVRANWRTVDASKLSANAQNALAFHLFLHRAVYGPIGIADLNLNDLQSFAAGPLEAEAATLRLEILTARNAQSAAAATEQEVL